MHYSKYWGNKDNIVLYCAVLCFVVLYCVALCDVVCLGVVCRGVVSCRVLVWCVVVSWCRVVCRVASYRFVLRPIRNFCLK